MTAPILLWFRRDLRLCDHPMLAEAVETGAPLIPVFLHDEVVEGQGAAPRFRLGLSVESFAKDLDAIGSKLVLRRGRALGALRELAQQTGARAVWWSRAYDPDARARDEEVMAGLDAEGIETRDFEGHLLFEPESVETQTGGFYKVYTPYWKAVRGRDPGAPLPAPAKLPAPESWPESARLADWQMARDMRRGAEIVARHVTVGERAARARLDRFVAERIEDYAVARDRPDIDGTSGLSENLTYGEISPRACYAAGLAARDDGKDGAGDFLKELVWREFAYHLLHHTPRLASRNWRAEWDGFSWSEDGESDAATAWKRGRTGMQFVDAAMREMYVTGRMHNRARMIVGSYLTKHLLTHWKIGQDWFADCLIDWDPASNALGWQWIAGSGPDATPYFRVFNPETQLSKFDPEGAYRTAWIAEGQADPPETARDYFRAVPQSWGLDPDAAYPEPVVTAAEGRERALAAYGELRGRP
ncbi:cryptochrome/photolyase family protein [Limimaricola pyoseonensis]|uniref:Deoxyribodipyrimidine photo-lyase type I n=1 Tax=Limimaricola pyoseonensis TaxID=521013 RepID=A0A1G7GTN8_9RHOB|nr:deoxyribodipyrimidine photo-lyase [Limimaricola pyoseonensis]SDE91512.1 deoxyribodipyrimidine photo-lyase type I [Limimaricola pyoseonensis]